MTVSDPFRSPRTRIHRIRRPAPRRVLVSTWLTAFAGNVALISLVPAVLSIREEGPLRFPLASIGYALTSWPIAFWVALPGAFTVIALVKDFLLEERLAAHLNSLLATFASVTCFTVAFNIATLPTRT